MINPPQPKHGITSLARNIGNEIYFPSMKNGLSYIIHQEAWTTANSHYTEFTVYNLSDIIETLKKEGNPLKRIVEFAIGRGVLAIGIALLVEDEAKIVGLDIEPRVPKLVKKNAEANNVGHKIEVRLGDMLSPLRKGEDYFDLMIFEVPPMPIDPEIQEMYIKQGYGEEILYISGGPDGRYFIDSLISQASDYMNVGGSLVFIQPSFIQFEQTMDKLAQHGFTGSILAQKPWRLLDTKFTLSNKGYIEKSRKYTFPRNEQGEEVFYLALIKGTKQ